MRLDQCICDQMRPLSIETKVVVILHTRETLTTSNTGRLLPVAVAGAEVRLRGGREVLDTQGLMEDGRQTLLLFPHDGAIPLDSSFQKNHPGPYTLLIPDGTWSQARKVFKREKALAGATPVCLVDAGPSSYGLRVSPREGALATFEAAAHALGVLEGPGVKDAMLALFHEFVRRNMELRRPSPGTISLPKYIPPEMG